MAFKVPMLHQYVGCDSVAPFMVMLHAPAGLRGEGSVGATGSFFTNRGAVSIDLVYDSWFSRSNTTVPVCQRRLSYNFGTSQKDKIINTLEYQYTQHK